MVSEEGKTVRQIRKEEKDPISNSRKFREWRWKPNNSYFNITIRFHQEQDEDKKTELVRVALQEAMNQIR